MSVRNPSRVARKTITLAALMEHTRSSSAAGDATRKRKRGALQDISNKNSKKLQQTRHAGVKKATGTSKPAGSRASTRRKTTATTVNSALKSSMASTAASKAKKRQAVAKKSDTRVKKRKVEGLENQPPHGKIQTSLLSFQKPQEKRVKAPKPEDDKENVQLQAKLEVQDNQLEVEIVKQEKTKVLQEDNQTEESVQVKSEQKTQEAQEQSVVVTSSVQEQPEDYAPRPYKFTFDHSSSCFDRETYAAAVRDIDAPSATVSSHYAKLVREVDAYYRKHEMKYLPEADYIGTVQMDIDVKKRTILVDWLVEVSREYNLQPQTLHKAVNLLDRCLKKIKTNHKQFQLLGCACMMIAAKFEEVERPNVEEFVHLSGQTYTVEEILDMETQVLNALEYQVASTTCCGFMHRYMKAGCSTDKQRSLVLYLCDFALLFYSMVGFKPSKLVASAVYLARITTGEDEPWTPTLHHVTQYNPLDIQDCIKELHRLHAIESQVVNSRRYRAKAASEKYLEDKFHAASTIPSCSKEELTKSFDQYSS